MSLIGYAGKDPEESQFGTRRHMRPERAYLLFSIGQDTDIIAKRLRVTEQTILRWITVERCKRRGLPSPYTKCAA